MSLGVGIVLASIFLGTVYLYVQTRDQWDWRKTWKRLLRSVGILLAIIVTLILSYFVYEKWANQPKLVTSLEGIIIGDRLSDVIFKHGAFEKDKTLPNGDEEIFFNPRKRLVLGVRNGVVRNIMYYCKRKELDFTSVNHIQCEDSGEEIYETFSNAVRVLCENITDKSLPQIRVYDAVEYGTRYRLFENKVDAFVVAEKSQLQSWAGLNWIPCN